jgi:mono/diheme cytochrome c family protein
MRKPLPFLALLLAVPFSAAVEAEDARQFVQLPEMMQTHMLERMRDHLAVLNEIMSYLSADDLDAAADTAEQRLGMSSMQGGGGGSMMGRHMPEGMRAIGQNMHRSASRFALKAQEGDVLAAYKALVPVTSSCVACHAGYRIR